jgi:hypothetical protein
MKGFSHLQRLLAHPGREFHALDFAASGSSTSASRAAATEAGLHPDTGDAGELLDADAKAAYRARIEDLREELEEAEAFGDQVRAARAKAEMDAIVGELSRAVGLGGRNRRASSTAERARINVTRTIRAAIDRVREQHPELGAHLDSAVRTGIYCAYQPDPAAAVAWTTER